MRWIQALFVLPCFAPFSAAQTVVYTLPFTVGDLWYLVGDVNADGLRDTAVYRGANGTADVYSGSTGVLLAHVAGTLAYPFVWFFFEAGDADGDHVDDLMYLARSTPNGLDWYVHVQLRSSATGSVVYTSPAVGPTLWNPTRRAAGISDITGDGMIEIVVGDPDVNFNAGCVNVINPATGAVIRSHQGTFPGEFRSDTRAIGDLDGDGYEDYIVRSAAFGTMSAHSGLSGQQLFALGGQGTSFGEKIEKVGDFNADGFDDFAIWTNGSFPFGQFERTSVIGGPAGALLWQQTWNYSQPVPPDFGRPTGEIGDLDGDGYDDLALNGLVISGRTQTVIRESTSSVYGSPGDSNDDGMRDLLTTILSGGSWGLHVVSGAPPGVASFGTPCDDSTGIAPAIGITTGARLGRTMHVNLSNANPDLLAALLVLGTSDQQWNGAPLPIGLGILGMPACKLRVSGDVLLPIPTGGVSGMGQHASCPIAVPSNPQLLGADVFAQWLVLELPDSGLTGAATRAMRTTVVP